MADDADMANEYIDNEVSRALGKLRQQNGGPQSIASAFCKECEEKIPDERRKLGFQFCVECAEEKERRKSLFADY